MGVRGRAKEMVGKEKREGGEENLDQKSHLHIVESFASC